MVKSAVALFRSPGAISGVLLALAISACAQATAKPQSRPQSAKPAAQETQKPAAAAASATPPAPKPRIATSPDGTKIAYETSGTGPALMLLHGGGQTRRAWNEQGYVDRLSKKFTVITVDQRGNGDSDKPGTAEAYAVDRVVADLLAVADAAGAARFHIWGFGQGASIGRYLAARSDRVVSAVLVGATMGPAVTGIVKDAMISMRAKWLPLLEAEKGGKLDVKALSPGDRTAWESGAARAAIAVSAIVEYPPLEPAEIKAPTLWLVGAADTSAMENVKQYEGKLAGTNVTLEILSSASYSECFIKLQDVMAKVEPFLARPPSTPSTPSTFSTYSARRATAGSTREARRAGT